MAEASKTLEPVRARVRAAPVLYACFVVAILFFALGRVWDPAALVIRGFDNFFALERAYRVALSSADAGPKPVPELPHAIGFYPKLAYDRGEQGDVLLDVLVRADGGVGDAKVERSSGYPQLDAAALVGVGYWLYTPAIRAHHAHPSWTRVRVSFRLPAR